MESQINRIIHERRSIYPKEFTGKVIDDNIIDVLLENANYAPNHKSNYPWRFIIIKGDALHNWLSEAADVYKDETPEEKFNRAKYDKILDYKHTVSHAIAILMHRDTSVKTVLNEDICAVAAAVQNMYLSLDAFPETAAYWSTGLGTYSARMSKYLQLDENETLMGYFVLGHVDVKRKEGKRRNFREFVRHL